ncbi:MAG: VOC family protein [Rhodospirillaceae bacterium]|nr:VOC family protein [Rhodospirillaceae bacterium]
MRVLGLDHIVLRVRDMERMVAFWRDVLGCPVEKVQAELGLVHIRAGSALIDLVDLSGRLGREGGAGPAAEGRNLDHFCLRVEPFEPEALRARLAAHGIAADSPKARFGAEGYGDSIYLTDPEGNRIELKGPSAA